MTINQRRKVALWLIRNRYKKAITALVKGDIYTFKELMGQSCEFCDIIPHCKDCPCTYDCYVPAELVQRCIVGLLDGDDRLTAMLSLYGQLQVMR